MRITRRNAITTLGILASGAAISGPALGDASQRCINLGSTDIPRECTPAADAWVLKYNKPDPKNTAAARKYVTENFVRGLHWGFAPYVPGPPKPKAGPTRVSVSECATLYVHDSGNADARRRAEDEFARTFGVSLDRSYAGSFDETVKSFLPGTVGSWAKLWVTLNDHAFILGALVVALRKSPKIVDPLTHRDYLRAQSKLMHAVSSVHCACFIGCQDSFGMPSAPDRSLAENKWLPDPLPNPKPSRDGGGSASGQIDEDCILCT